MSKRRALTFGIFAGCLALVFACSNEIVKIGPGGEPETDTDPTEPEGDDLASAGLDAGKDSGKDAGRDATTDAKSDASDAAVDSGPQPGSCTKAFTGGSGAEPGGIIPVCCIPTTTQKAEAMAVFNLLNQYRQQMGRSVLTYDVKLEASIQGHCEHMARHDFFDHVAPETSVKDPFVRAPLCGTPANAENIAWNQQTPAAVMTAWKNSPGHNTNMLQTSWKRVGVGRAGAYWGQVFAQ
jgi:uncharacterized protein YkwD